MEKRMTPEEARVRLGLEAGPWDRAVLKRAYLRAIKRHNPEVDPRGFQQVREAYELLDQLAKLGIDGPPVVVAAGSVEAPLPVSGPVPVEAETPGAPPAPEPGEMPPLPQAHLAAYRDRLEQLASAPWPLRAKVGWEAVRAFPGDPAARELLLELLPPEARSDISAVLLDGIRAGDDGCLVRLAQFNPGSVPDEALDRLDQLGAYCRFLAAMARIERRQGDRALAAVDELLSADATGSLDPLMIEGTLRVILSFEAGGDGERAGRARARLQAYLGGPSLPADAAAPPIPALFALVSDLGRADYLPPELRREVAKGILEGDLAGLGGAMTVAERTHGPATLERKLKRLEGEAPALHAVLAQHYVRVVETGSSVNWGNYAWIFVVVALAAVRGASSSCDSSTRSYTPVTYREEATSSSPPLNLQAANNPALQRRMNAAELQKDLFVLCQAGRDRALCEAMGPLLQSVDTTPCESTRVRLKKLGKRPSSLDGKQLILRVTAALPTVCPP
jgi:hypothetical protein